MSVNRQLRARGLVAAAVFCWAAFASTAAELPFGGGLAALAAGRPAQAISHFAAVRGALRPWAELHTAQALLAAGKPAEAEPLFRGLTDNPQTQGPKAPRGVALEGLATCLTRRGQHLEAAQAMAASIGEARLTGTAVAALVRLSALWLEAGAPGPAFRALLDAVELPGESSAEKRAAEAQLLKAHEAGRVTPVFAGPELTRWARLLARKGKFSDALDALGRASAPGAGERGELELARARYESRAGRREAASLRLVALAAEPSSSAGVRNEALLMLARVQRAANDQEAARQTLERLISSRPDDARAATARSELAELELSRGGKEAGAAWRQAIIDRYPATRTGAAILWQEVLAKHAAGDPRAASRLADRFLLHHHRHRLTPTVRYWRAITRQAAGLGSRDLEQLAADRGAGLFQVLAASRLRERRPRFSHGLKRPGALLRPPPVSRMLPIGQAANPLARELAASGAWEDLALLLEAERKAQPSSFAVRADLALAYARMGRLRESLRVAEATAGSAGRLHGYAPGVLRPLLYPVPFAGAFAARTAELRVDPFLALAVAREESRFQADNRSWADARGLMQILPSTGEWLARKFGIPGFGPERLYEPEYNIALGVRYLAYLQQMYRDYRNAELLALAAYNGGPGNVKKWLDKWGKLPFDEFLERIPLEETRFYVKKVADSLLAYERVYGGGPETPEPVPAPESGPANPADADRTDETDDAE